MNGTNVPKSLSALDRLAEELPDLTPQARKVAAYVLQNPQDVGVSSVRELAEAAEVTPNTVVRMARAAGYDGYEDFRETFRAAIRQGTASFPDRARWLQDLAKGDHLDQIYADMVGSALRNLEETFAAIPAAKLQAAAQAIWSARQVFTLGVGVNNSNAHNFTYLASTGMVQFHAIPRPGSSANDDLAFADDQDVLIAITNKPFRTEVVEAARVARAQGMTIIGISDTRAAPILREADFGFVTSIDTPQFFPSSVATIALLETLLSFVIAVSSPEIVTRVETFHARRQALGLYTDETGAPLGAPPANDKGAPQ